MVALKPCLQSTKVAQVPEEPAPMVETGVGKSQGSASGVTSPWVFHDFWCPNWQLQMNQMTSVKPFNSLQVMGRSGKSKKTERRTAATQSLRRLIFFLVDFLKHRTSKFSWVNKWGKRSSGCGVRGGCAGSDNGTMAFPHFPFQGYGAANMGIDIKHWQDESSLQDMQKQSFSTSISVRERIYEDIQSQLEEILWELCWTDTQMISYAFCVVVMLPDSRGCFWLSPAWGVSIKKSWFGEQRCSNSRRGVEVIACSTVDGQFDLVQ